MNKVDNYLRRKEYYILNFEIRNDTFSDSYKIEMMITKVDSKLQLSISFEIDKEAVISGEIEDCIIRKLEEILK